MFLFLKPTISFLKKAFLVIAVYFVVISLFSHFISRDKDSLAPRSLGGVGPIEKNRAEIYKVINDKELNKTKEGRLTVTLYKMSMCSMIGEACTDNPTDADKNYGKSVFGFIGNLIVLPYNNPPASGIAWVTDGLQQAGFVSKTFAAEGIGFAAIKPFSNLWKIFRDLSYTLLVITLIAIGFMIMFRTKINPQTVISVENALPKIVISLILITFSFAIAGFIIDLMYVLIGLIVSILIKNPTEATQFKNEYIMSTPTQMWNRDLRLRFDWPNESIAGFIGKSLIGILPLEAEILIRTVIGGLFTFLLNNPVNSMLGDPWSKVLDGWQAGTFGWGSFWYPFIKTIIISPTILYILYTFGFFYLITPIFTILIFFSILFLLFRIIITLFTNYVKLILLIIISPLLLLFEAVPGKSAFKYWIMNIIGNLLIFPLTISIFVLSYVIFTEGGSADFTARLPYLYGINSDAFRTLIAMGLIFLIPDLNKLVKEALGIKDLPINIGLGTFFGGVAAGAGGVTGALGQFGSLALAVNYLPGGRKLLDKISGATPNPGGGSINPTIDPVKAVKLGET